MKAGPTLVAFAGLVAICFADPRPAASQTETVNAAQIQSCLESVPPGAVELPCLGQASNACQMATPDGQTTLGISNCILAETAVWDDLLNREYGLTRTAFSNDAVLGEALLAAQRAWIAYRDAECALAYSRWADGSIRTIVGANCHLVMTARRVVELRDMRGEF